MKTPEGKTITMTFGSHPMRDLTQRWIARITFPGSAGPETVLELRVTDGEETPVDEGVFEFAGQRLEVRRGRASLTYAQFVAGKHETALWLHRPGLKPVPGGLTFG